MWIVYIAAIYIIHELYNYFIPWYWNKNALMRNGEEQRFRIKDALASTLLEDSTGMQYAEWGWLPHDYHSVRRRAGEGLRHPDDVRAMVVSAVNRKHRYVEHYRQKVGDDQTKMIGQ